MSIPGQHTTATQVWTGHQASPGWETPMARLGRGGINLVKPLDDLEPHELARMSNVVSRFGGSLSTRLGQTGIATTTGTQVHSLGRLNDPLNDLFTLFAGVNAEVFRGTGGALTSLDLGYSGDPLCLLPITLPLSGTPYMVIADRSRQRKATRTGAVETFGIPPAGAITTALLPQPVTVIAASFGVIADNTTAAFWTATAGQDRATPPNASGVPVLTDIAGPHVQMVTTVGGATGAYDNIMSIAKVIDFDTGITDDDQIRLQFNVSRPDWLEEIKVYFVCSSVFTPGAIPGNSANNQDAWFKSFRPSDMQDYFERSESGLDASDALRRRSILEQFKTAQIKDRRNDLIDTTGTVELDRQAIPSLGAGRNIWTIFGIPGIPLRRSDWQRIRGTEFSRGWGDITGIVIVVQTNTNQSITIQYGQFFLYGGSGPDNSDPGASGYDVRVINVHPVHGSKGNPSPVQASTAFLNALRQPIEVTPAASGNAALRQRAYLRGGSALGTQNWFFAGENNADGGAITITVADDVRITDEELEIDNDQPVTSVDATGATILNQTLPQYFMVEDYCFGCGDPNQPARLYRSKKGQPEQWPASDYLDVCAGSDELLGGGAVASAGFVFSRKRMFSILIDAEGNWETEPTACAEGPVDRWAFCVTPYGIAFVTPFAVKLTQGGVPEDLTSEKIRPLFQGLTVNGVAPIDFSQPTGIQLAYHDHELWFTSIDTGGALKQWIYNFFDKTWRSYAFGEPVRTVFSDPGMGAAGRLLMGGNASGQVYTHSGFSDDGAAIAYSFRTGTNHFGSPRNQKQMAEFILDGELQDGTVNIQARLNDELTTDTAQSVVGTPGYRRYTFEPFGTGPQHARNVSCEISGNAPTGSTQGFDKLGVTIQLQPEVVQNEPTPWEELPAGEGYCYGVLITCNTAGADKTVVVEYTVNNGAVQTAATLTINADGRKKLPFTWRAVLAQQIRLRGTGQCEPWMRFKVEWLSDPEPPRVIQWDTNWEDFGTKADKWLKGILLEADTFGAAKHFVIDVDQVDSVINLGALTFSGRGIQHLAFVKQRGRMFRARATNDSQFGKLYGWQPIFDEEPLALTRWESEERPFPGMDGRWQKPLEAYVCIRSSAQVSWTITTYGSGTTALRTDTYTIASTGGVKRKARVPLEAVKGLLFAHLFTAASAFWLYREESEVLVEDFNTGEARWVPLFIANDDLDPARGMGNSRVAAQTPGGA